MLKALSSQRTDFTGDLPTRIVVLPWGESEIDDGAKIRVGAKTLAQFAANQARYNFDRVALDFEHQTVPGSKTYQKDPVKVAAFGVPAVIEGEGLVLENLEWTAEGREFVGGRHYVDLSPVVKHDDSGEVIFLHSTAVCRQGQVRGLKLFSAADPFTSNDNHMDFKKILTAILGLGDDASDDQIKSGAEALATKMDGLKAMSATVEGLETKLASFSATPAKLTDEQAGLLTTLTAKVDSAVESIKALTARNEALERQDITREAIAQGKIIPKSAKDLSLEHFKALCADLPADQVPVSRRTPEGVQEFAAKTPTNDAAESVRKQLGISEDVWKKHAK